MVLPWDEMDPLASWESLIGTGMEQSFLMAFSTSELAVHGQVYSRTGVVMSA